MSFENNNQTPPPPPGPPAPTGPVPPAPPAAAPGTPGPQASAAGKVSIISWIALGVAVLGFIIACFPGGILFAWLPLLAALILAIVGLVKQGRKWAPLTALILSVIGGIVGVITLFAGLAMAVNDAIEDATGTSVEQPNTSTDEGESGSDAEAPEEDAGTSRENPAAIGSKISGDEWDVVVNSVTLGATDAVLAAEKLINEPPADGNEFILVNVTTTYTGDDKGMPAFVRFAYVTPEGNTIDGLDQITIAPEPLDTLSELYTDASATGNIVLSVPSATAADGVLAVTPGMFADEVFVSVK